METMGWIRHQALSGWIIGVKVIVISKISKHRKLILIGLDSFFIAASVGIAYAFYHWHGGLTPDWRQILLYGAVSVLSGVFMMNRFRLYNRAWRYASIGELISTVKAVSMACAVAYAGFFLLEGSGVPIPVFVLTFQSILLFTGGSRLLWRMITDNYAQRGNGGRRTMVVGAGDCGVLITKEMKFNGKLDLYPVCFIDDNPLKHGQHVNGCIVVGGRDKIVETAEKYRIDEIIIAIPSASRSQIAEIIEICKRTNARLRIIPPIEQLMDGKITLKSMRDVDVEDLLGREPVKLQLDGIAGYLEGKTVMVTGAGGSIGSELCRQIARFKPGKLLLLGRGEYSIYQIDREIAETYPRLPRETIIADVQNRERMEQVFGRFRPQVVFHAAAYKHVPLMENNPGEAVRNNVFGTKNVAECADRYGAERFVLVSTDKAVNPTSIMGATKRIAEMLVQSLDKHSKTIFSAVRFGNVLGSRGSVIPLFKEQIKAGGPVTVTHPDMVRYFMTIPEACQLVIQAGAFATGGEVFLLDMGKPVKIADLARDLIRLSGYEPDKDIPISYIGIRPGEKLYEEMLTAEEGSTSTKHDRIFVGKPGNYDIGKLEFELKKLAKTLDEDHESIRRMLHQLVPNFREKSADMKESVEFSQPIKASI